ncbi:hypothetical protein [Desulfosporosinus sp. OT]|nr:hypothetical protein [Desulfosporosinus sp. OT]EGW38339.1 hypothetical protein DOT_3816 [Desulfosporosinus sp. OT]
MQRGDGSWLPAGLPAWTSPFAVFNVKLSVLIDAIPLKCPLG